MPLEGVEANAWKYDFVVTCKKVNDLWLYLENRSCQDAMNKILIGNITGCNDPSHVDAKEILGGTQQVGVFGVQ